MGRTVRWVPDFTLDGVPARVLAKRDGLVLLSYVETGNYLSDAGGVLSAVSWVRYRWVAATECVPL